MAIHESSHASSLFSRSEQQSSAQAGGLAAEDPKLWKACRKAERYMLEGRYDQAMRVLNGVQQHPGVRNLKGICLMRTGAVEQAVQLYRGYVLHAGSTRCRVELGDTHVINFATALLMSGRPAGCLEVLSELTSSTHPGIARLRATIRSWSRGLNWWNRLSWWLWKLCPGPDAIPLSFLPGEMSDSAPASTTSLSSRGTGSDKTHTAI